MSFDWLFHPFHPKETPKMTPTVPKATDKKIPEPLVQRVVHAQPEQHGAPTGANSTAQLAQLSQLASTKLSFLDKERRALRESRENIRKQGEILLALYEESARIKDRIAWFEANPAAEDIFLQLLNREMANNSETPPAQNLTQEAVKAKVREQMDSLTKAATA